MDNILTRLPRPATVLRRTESIQDVRALGDRLGAAKFDLVAWIFGLEFGETNGASRVVYGLVGLAAVYGIGSLLTAGRRLSIRPAAEGAH